MMRVPCSTSAAIVIRPLSTHQEYRRCQELQKEIWGFSDLMVIPVSQLISAQEHGGLVLGAFDGPEMIGFLYGYLGRRYGRFLMFSQRMGVLPAYRGRGIGYRMKLFQREHALAQGIDLVVWTYDPLEGANAFLNVTKLGVIARRYERDVYGDTGSILQAGLPTDRFWVEWYVDSPRVRERLAPHWRHPQLAELLTDTVTVNQVNWDTDRPIPGGYHLDLDSPYLAVEIPPDIQALKRQDLALARRWQDLTRTVFETYFARGYAVVGFARGELDGRQRTFYRLERNPSLPPLPPEPTS